MLKLILNVFAIIECLQQLSMKNKKATLDKVALSV